MTFAWYGHLKFEQQTPVSGYYDQLGYCFWICPGRCRQTNRFSYYDLGQLKIIQEVITMIVFIGFAIIYMKQPWNGFSGRLFAWWARFTLFSEAACRRICDANDFDHYRQEILPSDLDAILQIVKSSGFSCWDWIGLWTAEIVLNKVVRALISSCLPRTKARLSATPVMD